MKVTLSCVTLWDPMYSLWNYPGQNIGVGSLSLLQQIFLTQEWIAGGFFTSWANREGITIYLLGWSKSPKYKLKTPNAEKDVEQQQFTVIIGLSVKWYSHFGRQFINFLQHQTYSYHAAAAVTSVVSDSVWPNRRQPTRLLCPWYSPVKNTGVGCHFLLQCMKLKSESEVAQSCPTQRSHGLEPTRLLHPWDFPGKSTGVGATRKSK